LFIIDGSGKLIEHFAGNEGLQNNNIHSLLLDRDRNLWLGLENGLDFINYNTSVKHIYPDKENQLKSTAIRVFDQKLFIGTSNGLYFTPISPQLQDKSTGDGLFTEVAGTKGQVLSLNEIDHQLLMGHEDGASIISNNKASAIIPWQGVWQLIPMPASADVIAGTYTGLQLVKNTGAGFKDAGGISGIYESLANLALDNDQVIWASHPYRGIFRIRLSADRKKIVQYTKYTSKNGLPSNLNNRVYFIRNKLIAATTKGIYEYNKARNGFEASSFFNPIFADANIEYLTEDSWHNIWFISNQRVGVVDFNKPSGRLPYTVIYFPELVGQTVKGSEFIYPYNADNVFVGSNNGIFHLNYRQYVNAPSRLSVLLTSVKAIAEKDSLVFGGYFMNNGKPSAIQNSKQVTQPCLRKKVTRSLAICWWALIRNGLNGRQKPRRIIPTCLMVNICFRYGCAITWG
jgi:ligand-binding sensor domain-containing protein